MVIVCSFSEIEGVVEVQKYKVDQADVDVASITSGVMRNVH